MVSINKYIDKNGDFTEYYGIDVIEDIEIDKLFSEDLQKNKCFKNFVNLEKKTVKLVELINSDSDLEKTIEILQFMIDYGILKKIESIIPKNIDGKGFIENFRMDGKFIIADIYFDQELYDINNIIASKLDVYKNEQRLNIIIGYFSKFINLEKEIEIKNYLSNLNKYNIHISSPKICFHNNYFIYTPIK